MPNTIQIHRVLCAAPEKVYRAFLDLEAMPKGPLMVYVSELLLNVAFAGCTLAALICTAPVCAVSSKTALSPVRKSVR